MPFFCNIKTRGSRENIFCNNIPRRLTKSNLLMIFGPWMTVESRRHRRNHSDGLVNLGSGKNPSPSRYRHDFWNRHSHSGVPLDGSRKEAYPKWMATTILNLAELEMWMMTSIKINWVKFYELIGRVRNVDDGPRPKLVSNRHRNTKFWFF